MNRIIKFRVWDSVEKVFLHKKGILQISFNNNGLFFPYGTGKSNLEWPDRFVVQQYTGYKDKNGKEIYEGDILKEYISNESKTAIGICKQVLGGWKIFSHPDSSIAYHGWKHEVIGNIFENPELLT